MAGKTFLTQKGLAARAGRTTKTKLYDKAWLKLGKDITDVQAKHVKRYMAQLWEDGRDEEAFDAYLKLLQYFKPKVMAHAVKTQTEVVFRFESTDKELFEDV